MKHLKILLVCCALVCASSAVLAGDHSPTTQPQKGKQIGTVAVLDVPQYHPQVQAFELLPRPVLSGSTHVQALEVPVAVLVSATSPVSLPLYALRWGDLKANLTRKIAIKPFRDSEGIYPLRE